MTNHRASAPVTVDEWERLRLLAESMVARAYAPRSHFHVGAAVVTYEGEFFGGCNVENISYGLTICAERSAIFAAVAGTIDVPRVEAVYIAVGPNGALQEIPAAPCGACRQVIAEFGPDALVSFVHRDVVRRASAIDDLLPERFEL